MKNTVIFSLILFILIIGGIFVYSNIHKPVEVDQNQDISRVQSIKIDTSTTQSGSIVNSSNTTTGKTFTMEEIAKHNIQSDCWMAIQNKVYDVTPYMGNHPGGNDTLTEYCGKEATKAFETKDQNQPHSDRAWVLLKQYYVGEIGK